MQIIQEKIDSLNAILKLEVKKEDYESKINDTLKTYRKKVDVKGFRKGNVPIGIVKKMYGNNVLADTVNDVLNHEVNNYIVENKLDVLGNPLPKEGQIFDLEINNIKDFEFEYEIGLAPEFKLIYLDNKPTLEKEVIKIDKKLINDEVARVRKRYGKVEVVVGEIEEDDMLTMLFEELDENGQLKENGVSHSAPIALDMIKDVKAKKAIKKLKKGENIVIDDLTKVFEKKQTEVAKQLLGLELIPEVLPVVQASLQEVKRVIAAEMNEAFFQAVYGLDSDVKTEADMRVKIEEEIAKYFDAESDKKLYNKLAAALIENTKMDFPDTFLKRWIKLTNEKPISEEQIEKEYPAFSKNLKWSLIVKKVSKENNINVTMEEVKAKIAIQVRQQMLQYGINEMSPEEIEKFVTNTMAKKDHVAQTRETLLEEKLFDYFKNQIQIQEKKVTLEEFYNQESK